MQEDKNLEKKKKKSVVFCCIKMLYLLKYGISVIKLGRQFLSLFWTFAICSLGKQNDSAFSFWSTKPK